jgi:DNA-binding XRE family transcriptional regulator
MNIGNRIRTLRRSLNMSQPELAKKAKVGQSTISDLENDKKSTSANNKSNNNPKNQTNQHCGKPTSNFVSIHKSPNWPH